MKCDREKSCANARKIAKFPEFIICFAFLNKQKDIVFLQVEQ